MSAPQRSYGPSWGDVALAQGDLQAKYGGFVVIWSGQGNSRYNPRVLWWRVQWSPSLAHVEQRYSWSSSNEWPSARYSTVPEMLMSLVRDLDSKLAHVEQQRSLLGLPALRDSVPGDTKDLPLIVT